MASFACSQEGGDSEAVQQLQEQVDALNEDVEALVEQNQLLRDQWSEMHSANGVLLEKVTSLEEKEEQLEAMLVEVGPTLTTFQQTVEDLKEQLRSSQK